MTTLGASLKKARESQGISLEQIATETRISSRFLTAIEDEEFHRLPGGVFNRGFVRAYAQCVGMDPDQAVADYEYIVEAREPNATFATAAGRPASQIERYLYPIALGILILLIGIYYAVTSDSPDTQQILRSGPVTVLQPDTQAVPQTPVTAPGESASAAIPPGPAPLDKPLRIDLEAKERTWIKVTADGNTVNAGEILAPGATRRFTAQSSIDLSIGNAAGLALRINDMHVKPLGQSGQVRELTITPATLKEFIS